MLGGTATPEQIERDQREVPPRQQLPRAVLVLAEGDAHRRLRLLRQNNLPVSRPDAGPGDDDAAPRLLRHDRSACSIAVPLGVYQAYRRDRFFDKSAERRHVPVHLRARRSSSPCSSSSSSSSGWELFPRIGDKIYPWEDPGRALPQLLPADDDAGASRIAAVLTPARCAPTWSLTLQSDFISLARAKGMSPRRDPVAPRPAQLAVLADHGDRLPARRAHRRRRRRRDVLRPRRHGHDAGRRHPVERPVHGPGDRGHPRRHRRVRQPRRSTCCTPSSTRASASPGRSREGAPMNAQTLASPPSTAAEALVAQPALRPSQARMADAGRDLRHALARRASTFCAVFADYLPFIRHYDRRSSSTARSPTATPSGRAGTPGSAPTASGATCSPSASTAPARRCSSASSPPSSASSSAGSPGIIAGYRRGKTDRVLGIFTDSLLAMPGPRCWPSS